MAGSGPASETTPSIKSSNSAGSGSGLSPADSLYQVKLLAALRSGDPALIHPFLTEIGKDRRNSTSGQSQAQAKGNDYDTGAAALHLAIRCASVPTITLLLSHRAISPNGIHPPGSGNTPLHLAASLGRVEVVNLLLEQEGINDTIRDIQGRSVKDVAKTKEVTKALQDSHTFLNATYRSLLHSYVSSPTNPPSPPPPALISLLSSPRIAHVNLSYLDDTNGQSLLHEAARRKDLRLLELALRAGADVFVRNRRGRVAFEKDKEGGEVDERVRVFLRQFANQDATLLDDSTSSLNHPVVLESPTLKGYLNKYANVAKGYNTRWFVLQNGVLSYYRHQEDELIASRGSISMRSATLKPSSSDRNRFEIYSTPTTKHHHSSSEPHSGQKWYIKANHHGEAARWVNAIRRSIEWCARQDGISHSPGASGGSGSVVSSPVVGPGESGRSTPILIKTPDIGGGGGSGGGRGSSPSPGGRTGTLLRKKKNTASGNYSTLSASVTSGMSTGNGSDHESIHSTRGGGTSGMLGAGGGGGGTDDERSIRSGSLRSSWMPSGTPSSVRATGPVTGVASSGTMADEEAYTSGGGGGGGLDNDHAEEDSIEIVENEDKLLAPYEDSIALQANTLLAQLDITKELIGHLTSPPPAPGTSGPGLVPSSPIKGTMLKRETDLKTGLSASFATLESSVKEYVAKIGERDGWYKRKVADMRKEVEGWEGMVRTVVREGEGLEKELRDRARRRGSRMFLDVSESGPGGGSTIKNRPSVLARALKATREEEPSEPLKRPTLDGLPRALTQEEVKTPTPASPVSVATPISLSQSRFISPTIASSEVKGAEAAVDDDDQYDTDEEDEFFDAIESGTLPGLVVDEALLSSTTQGSIKSSSLALSPPPYSTSAPSIPDSSSGKLVPPSQSYLSFLSSYARQYQGYVDLRASLDLSGKEMPSTSLWSVLKHSIGKDLTKISFPVHFNEPTSMLQRMGEDMEFSGCLDAAAKERDPLRRIAFVAAFAMSNYSSTIGRIAKPFNPMLSETFEYVRLDKQYRYMSEQVSHHPPISACWAESPTWHYYGEVDAQNKFMGKSFEIRPTGVAHAELLIPEDRITRGKEGYPKAKGRHGKGKVVEHYTWKKVTTNISGFILGSPTIDHYGDMVVTNHRTGDQCILTFKPRGWRGKDAYEIAGHVIDASSGLVAYDIAGRWNSQLIARPTINNPSRASLDPDLEVRDRNASNIMTPPTSPLSSNAPFLLWINSEKPAGSPFNLTPYAITLNDCPSSLRPYLCPTDCRLRPDQRAFELGEYDLANDLKRAQEEKQRSIRKMREEGRLAPHRPRWFVAETDGDTGERVWTPIRVGDSEDGPIDQDWGLEYWAEREKVAKEIDEKASSAKGKTKWKGVEDIFIETPDFVKELMEEQEAKNT